MHTDAFNIHQDHHSHTNKFIYLRCKLDIHRNITKSAQCIWYYLAPSSSQRVSLLDFTEFGNRDGAGRSRRLLEWRPRLDQRSVVRLAALWIENLKKLVGNGWKRAAQDLMVGALWGRLSVSDGRQQAKVELRAGLYGNIPLTW